MFTCTDMYERGDSQRHMHDGAPQGREEELQHEVRALQLQLERARIAVSAGKNSPVATEDPLMAKYKAFKRQAAVFAVADA